MAISTIGQSGLNAPLSLTSPSISGAVMSSMGSSVITSSTAQSGGTSIDFSSIPSWVKRITVMFNAIQTSGGANVLVQLGTASSFETTGYSSSASAAGNGSAVTVVSSTSGFVVYFGTASYYIISGSYVFTNVTGNTWVGSGVLSNITTVPYGDYVAGVKTTAAVLTRVRLTTTTGTDTFSGGSFNIFYE